MNRQPSSPLYYDNKLKSRYFPVEEGHEDLTLKDLCEIVGAYSVFYSLLGLILWGTFCFGLTQSNGLMIMNIVVFVCAVIWISAMLIYGRYTNRLVAKHQFYQERISEREQELRDQHQRETSKKERAHAVNRTKAKVGGQKFVDVPPQINLDGGKSSLDYDSGEENEKAGLLK